MLLYYNESRIMIVDRNKYQHAFGIDYRNPNQYLVQGEQTRISDPTMINKLLAKKHNLVHLRDIYRWIKREFTAYSAFGDSIGIKTADQLLTESRLGGCHDYGLVYAAVVCELGYPTVMVRTNSLAWVKRFHAEEPEPYIGHIFVEIFLNDTWIIIDPTNGWYVKDFYDPSNPVIPLKEQEADSRDMFYGYFVERKGIDIWSMGIHNPTESFQAMEDFAHHLNLDSISYPDYKFLNFME